MSEPTRYTNCWYCKHRFPLREIHALGGVDGMTDDLCHGYHVWVRRGLALECSRCGFTIREGEG